MRTEELPPLLAGATGVSHGVAHEIPARFLGWPSAGRLDLHALPDGDGDAGGVPCWKMTSRSEDGWRTLWVGKADHAIHRVTASSHLGGAHDEVEIARVLAQVPEERRAFLAELLRKPHPFTADTTIDYAPVFDRPIAPSRFRFTPPVDAP